MPPPVANTLLHLQSPQLYNSNRATLPNSNIGLNDHLATAATRLNDTILQQPTSVINLTNSTDVVIGPMTQYQGAVTIYQYMDATVQRAENSNNRRHLGNFLISRDSHTFAKYVLCRSAGVYTTHYSHSDGTKNTCEIRLFFSRRHWPWKFHIVMWTQTNDTISSALHLRFYYLIEINSM